MAITANDVLRVTAGWLKGAADQVQNVFTYAVDDLGSATQDDMLDFIAAVIEIIYTECITAISDQLFTDTINVFNRTKNEPYGSQAWPVINQGTAGGSILPLQVTFDAYGQTPVNKVRGRKSWPVTTEDNLTGGLFSGDAITGFGDASAAWLLDYTDIPTGANLQSGVERSVGLGAGTLARFNGGGVHALPFTRKNRRPGLGG